MKDNLTFVAPWIDLEDFMLSKISQTEKENTVWYQLHVESKRAGLVKTESKC